MSKDSEAKPNAGGNTDSGKSTGNGNKGMGAAPVPDRESLMKILAYVPVLAFYPLLSDQSSDEVRRHAQQGKWLTFLFLIIWILRSQPGLIEDILSLGLVAVIVLCIVGMVYALQGRFWRIPFIADLAERGERKSKGGESA